MKESFVSNKRSTYAMVALVLAGFAIILMMNVSELMQKTSSNRIAPTDVKGIAVEQDNKLYTLNFEQQNALVRIFNELMPVTKAQVEANKTEFKNGAAIDKILLYQMNGDTIEITPIGYSKVRLAKDNEEPLMVLQAPAWHTDGYLQEIGKAKLNKILLTTYKDKPTP